MSLFLLLLLVVTLSCNQQILLTKEVYEIVDPFSEDAIVPGKYLKLHLRNGYLAVIKNWEIDEENQKIIGVGHYFNRRREQITPSNQNIETKFEDCVLVESNQYPNQNFISPALMAVTTFTGIITLPCIADPKSCFGSCPTFYLQEGDTITPQVEAFSSSITKALEATDIDRLSITEGDGNGVFRITVKNEAHETHYIRSVELLAVPKVENSFTHHGDDFFYRIDKINPPISVDGKKDSVLQLFQNQDQWEYFSESDPNDLTAKESKVIHFDLSEGNSSGILITKRQSLMTTYLFYQSLAYMGRRVGNIMAAYERASPWVRKAQSTIYDILGGIEVEVLINDRWIKVGSINEQGPIASDTHLIPINRDASFSQVKLTMSKGLWRIDQVAVCNISERKLEPLVLEPVSVTDRGTKDEGLSKILVDPDSWLVTNPGASHTLEFELPKGEQFDLFLRSKGYYTEWIRSEWLKEENLEMTKLILTNPKKWLRIMAPKYKLVEGEMEDLFWSSKYNRHEY